MLKIDSSAYYLYSFLILNFYIFYKVKAIQNRIFYYCLLTAQKKKNGELSCTVKLEDIKWAIYYLKLIH